ncbi:MAG: ATP-binding protein [bacterium]
MIFISVIPLAVMGIRAILMNRDLSRNVEEISSDSLATSILDKQNHLSMWMADFIDDYFSNILQNISIVVDGLKRPDLTNPQRKRVVEATYATTREFVAIAVYENSGKPAFYAPPEWGFNREVIAKLSEGLLPGKFATGDVRFYGEFPIIDYVYCFGKSRFVYAVLNMDRLLKKIKDAPSSAGEEIFVISGSGKIILHSDREKMLEQKNIGFLPFIKGFIASSIPTSSEFNGINNIPMIGAISGAVTTGWGIVVWQTKSTAYAPVAKVKTSIKEFSGNLLRYTYLQIVAISLIAFFLAFYLAKSISRPLLDLSRGAARVAGRDFSEPVRVKSKDEIGDLADVFNFMMEEMKKYDQMQADKLDALVFSIKDGLVMIDHSEKIILANEMARGILSLGEECIGNFIQAAVGNQVARLAFAELRAEKNENENERIEINLSHDDMPKFYEANKYSVTSRDGVALGSIITLRDITLEKELAKMKEDFLHSITHDLRSPMTSIRGFLEIMIDGSAGELNEEQKNFLKIMDESSEKLLTMINNLLDVSKLEAGKMVLNLGEVDVNKLARSIVDFFYPQAKSMKVNLSFKEAAVAVLVPADENLIERVVTNLVSNAMKFTAPGGSVTVTAKDEYPEKGKIYLEVADTGKGIPKEEIGKVFEKFHQVSDTALKKTGTGLGLTVCKYIVETHLGKIWAESEFGKGSVFCFWIPKDLYKENGEVKREQEGKTGRNEIG